MSASRSESIRRLDSPSTPMIVAPSQPASFMKLMHLSKPSRSTVSSALNGVAMIGHTPVKLAMVRLAGASAARRMAAEREASIAAERSLPAAGATARRRQRDDSGVAATRAWASAARAGRQVATHV